MRFPDEIFSQILSFAGDILHIKRDQLWKSISLVNHLQEGDEDVSPNFSICIKNHPLPTSVTWVGYDGRYQLVGRSIVVYPRLIRFGVSSYDLVKTKRAAALALRHRLL